MVTARKVLEQPFTLVFAETVQAKPGECYARPDWDCWTFEYILSGKGYLQLAGETYTLEPGDMYVLPKGLAHRYWADEKTPWRKRFFVVNGSLVNHLLQLYRLDSTYYIPTCESRQWFDRMYELHKSRSPESHERGAILLHELLISLSRRVNPPDRPYSQPVQKAVYYLRQHIEQPVRMDEVAVAAGRSKSQLSRVFRDEVGLTPYDYLIQLRMDQARSMLSLTAFTIAEIADRLCYADAYYFSNAFKQRFGMSPKAFRNKVAEPLSTGT